MAETLIYGGAFNPPTKAHGEVIEACLAQTGAEEVWVMPSADRFDKHFEIAKEDRLAMLQLMLGELSCGEAEVAICRLEIDELPAPTETALTYQALKDKYPGTDFRFIFGSDAYNSMPEWRGGSELQATLPMLVSPRNGDEITPRANIHILQPFPAPNVSSTEVRERIKAGEPIDEMVYRPVADYLHEHKLYE